MGKTWTEERIEIAINAVRYSWGLDRMPSRSEVETYYGDASLSNAISKSGGFYYWAKKLGLEIKTSDTKFGFAMEDRVKEILENLGHECDWTSCTHPYDLLVNKCVKVDVKAARTSKAKGSDCYSFRLAKPQQTCDVYVAVCLDDNEKPLKVYVIPAHVMTGKKQLVLGVGHSKYDVFINRWDIIKQLSEAFAKVS